MIILDAIQDPGNIGTIIRTIVAVNYRTLKLTKTTGDDYSPTVVRAAMGGI
ncbi:TrmH family RNA methyltransferase [Streptobacillus moniliformis]|uniref:TrmH family RNA methyltransferase n=1 Tax=Streptobacillus moniliformis TaxID=34105 RepID=UPI0018C86C4A|nr:TrmH family RNA methyltransferase [Streptobacillus moniliformis]